MAVLLWKHGVGALAKALVAVRLNKYLVEEFKAAEKTETNLAAEFQAYADEWEELSYSLLDTCFKLDCQLARQLLTMELEHWSKQTCLTLAVTANHRMLLGHPCCQILLADLWMGALHHQHTTMLIVTCHDECSVLAVIRSYLKCRIFVQVLAGIVFPPLALCCDFKTREELKLLPHQGKREGMLSPDAVDQQLLDDASLQTFTKSKASIPSSIFLQRLRRRSKMDGDHQETAGEGKHAPETLFRRNEQDDVILVKRKPKVKESGHRVTILEDIVRS